MSETRKITAILARRRRWLQPDGRARTRTGTLARLRTLRLELIDPTVASPQRAGSSNTPATGLSSSSAAWSRRCAARSRSRARMIERNVGMPSDQRIDFRMGIHLGDVVEESDGDLMGDGVNIAARFGGARQTRGDLPFGTGLLASREGGWISRSSICRQDQAEKHRRVIRAAPIRLKSARPPSRRRRRSPLPRPPSRRRRRSPLPRRPKNPRLRHWRSRT